MTQLEWAHLGVAVALALLAAWLACVEAALHTMSRARAHALIDQGASNAAGVLKLAEDPAPAVNTSTLVRIIAQVLTALLVARVIFDHLGPLWAQLLVAAAVLVLVWYIVWGVGPQTLGRLKADQVARHAVRPLRVLTALFGPLAQLLILVGNAVTPGRGFSDGPFTTAAELRDLVDFAEESDVIEEGEAEMIHSVFELGDTLVREVMVPRTDVVTIGATKNWRAGLSLAMASGFSRIPVTGESLDDIVGVLHIKDVMGKLAAKPEAVKTGTIRSVMRPASFCPDSKPVDKLLRDMQATRTHMMIVVDEFGGMAGIVTLEDIVEEIVGEITDEYDAEPIAVEDLGDGAWRVPARMPLDELGELVGVELEDEDVETAAGLLAKVLSQVPTPGANAIWRGLSMTADEAVGRRHQIVTLVVRPARDPESTDEEEEDGHGQP